jgi:hypothetical protein
MLQVAQIDLYGAGVSWCWTELDEQRGMRSRRVSAATTWRDMLLEQGTCRRGAGCRVQLAQSCVTYRAGLMSPPPNMAEPTCLR